MGLSCQVLYLALTSGWLPLVKSTVPGGSAREALRSAMAIVQESDESLHKLEESAKPSDSLEGRTRVGVEAILEKASHWAVSLGSRIRVHNTTFDMPRFARSLRRLSKEAHPLSVPNARGFENASSSQDVTCRFSGKPAWRSAKIALFMHIGKAGGTAFRETILSRTPRQGGEVVLNAEKTRMNVTFAQHSSDFSIDRLKWRYVKRNKHEYGDGNAWEFHIPELLVDASRWFQDRVNNGTRPTMLPCLCTAHFDFSLVEPLYRTLPQGAVLGLSMMRNPVRRFLSHYYFSRTQDWSIGTRLRDLPPLKFLYQPDALIDALMVWQDGAAGVAWFAGTTVHCGMGATGDKADNNRLRISILNRTETLRNAVKNYHKFQFVGILEELDSSLELLADTLGWTSVPQMELKNAASTRYPEPSPAEMRRIREALRILAPMDTWFYHYVRSDFHARLRVLKSRRASTKADRDRPYARSCRETERPFTTVKLPSEQELGGCTASRQALSCLSDVYVKPDVGQFL